MHLRLFTAARPSAVHDPRLGRAEHKAQTDEASLSVAMHRASVSSSAPKKSVFFLSSRLRALEEKGRTGYIGFLLRPRLGEGDYIRVRESFLCAQQQA